MATTQLLFALFMVVILSCYVSGFNISYQTGWFKQKVDHFTWANQDTYQQRYLYNNDSWCGKNCPILFYTGNEGDIETFTNNTGFMWENAAQLKAMLIFAEHRYYGKSFPYDVDPTKYNRNETEKLGYLTSEQALADFATLLEHLKNNVFDAKLSPVIAVGGSYGGMLAAWMRMKYPNIIEGALAGSAPILQFPGEYNCNEFNRIVTKDFEDYSKNCSKSISRSWGAIRRFGETEEGRAKLTQAFTACQTVEEHQVENIITWLYSIWGNLAMTDYGSASDFLSPKPAYPIKHACEYLKDDVDDEFELLKGISGAAGVYANYTGQLECLNLDETLDDPMDVMWDFQACTEMVMPICADGIQDMFEEQKWDLDEYSKQCDSQWGVKPDPKSVMTLYGDKNMSAYSNIIFSSCSRDPWSAGCPQESLESKSIFAIKIKGVCHHEDLRPSGPNDSNELKAARVQEMNIITDWITKYYDNIKHKMGSLTWTEPSNIEYGTLGANIRKIVSGPAPPQNNKYYMHNML